MKIPEVVLMEQQNEKYIINAFLLKNRERVIKNYTYIYDMIIYFYKTFFNFLSLNTRIIFF